MTTRFTMTAQLLVIDNYDSFTFNLVQMFRHFDLKIDVFRADRITLDDIDRHAPDYVLISPGPKDPSAAGISTELIRRRHRRVPILGVCLGMQCINEAFGGTTIRATVPVHGKTSTVKHNRRGVFSNLPTPFVAARYHSLVVNGVPEVLEITAETPDGVVMGLAHRESPLFGVQFHPESFLTEHGFSIIENFLRIGSLKGTLS